MASVNKINLCDDTQTKDADATLTCKTVLLPPYADDVLIVTKCGLSGQVDATLQHSPDGVRWKNCQVKKITAAAGAASFGNEWHLDTIPKSGEKKNKYLLQYSGFGGSSTDDVTTSFMAYNKPFNLSWWMRTNVAPSATYSPILFRCGGKLEDADAFDNIKALRLTEGAGEAANKFLQVDASSQTAIDAAMTTGTSFTYNTWLKTNTAPATSSVVPYTPTKSLNNPNTILSEAGRKELRCGDGIALTSLTNENFDFNDNAGFAISWWFKDNASGFPTNVADGFTWISDDSWAQRFIAKFEYNTTKFRVLWSVNSGHTIHPYWDVNSTNVDDGNWHHMLIQYKGKDEVTSLGNTDAYKALELWIDGVEIAYDASSTTAGTPTTQTTDGFPNKPLSYGKQHSGWGNAGHIAEVSMWSRELTSSEIAELYNSGAAVEIDQLSFFISGIDGSENTNCTLYYNFADANDAIDSTTDAGSGAGINLPYNLGTNSIIDQSGNGNHGYVTANMAQGVTNIMEIDSTTSAPAAPTTYTTTGSGIIFRNGGKTGTPDFGDGLTISITDKYKTSDGSYVPAGGQGTKLVISMDGYENSAAKVLVYNTDLADNTWKNLQVTYDHTNGGLGTDNIDRISTFVNGVELSPLGSPSITFGSNNNYFKNVSDTIVNAVIGGSGFLEAGGVGGTDNTYNLQADIMDTSIHSEAIDLTKAQAIYNSGTPSDLDEVTGITDSAIKCWWKFEETAANSAPQGAADANPSNSRSCASNHLVLNNFKTDLNSVQSLATSDTEYFKESRFGEGITISLTDKINNTTGAWTPAGGQDPCLLVSFNGFENDAEQWVAWKCTQADINGDSGDAVPANLLDNTWHNITLSYKGVTSDGDTANFGRGGSSGHDTTHWNLGINGYKQDHLNTFHGVDFAKSAANGQNVTLAMKNYHLKNVNNTYVRTSFFGSGFLEDLVSDSIYAYQGKIDETSFDSSSWWRNPAGAESGLFCECPLEVLWGNNDQREDAVPDDDNYAFTALSEKPGVPHDLLDPLSVNTDPINNKKAYIDPFPTGQFRCSDGIAAHKDKATCDANSTVHAVERGTCDIGGGAHTNNRASCEAAGGTFTPTTNWIENNENYVGGIEWYYRWGDIATDCKVCVNDARAFTKGVSSGEPAVNEEVTERSAAVKGSLSVNDLKASSTSNGGAAETIYVQGSAGGGGTTTDFIDLVNNCTASGEDVITHLNVPHLQYLRLVYTGSTACNPGDCVGDLFYSVRRKK